MSPAPPTDIVELRATLPEVEFFLLAAEYTDRWGTPRGYRPLCIAPCSAALAPGSYRMAVAKKGEPKFLVPGNVDVPRGGRLEARYPNGSYLKSGLLFLGGAVAILGGAALIATGDGDQSIALPAVLGVGGLGVIVWGIAISPFTQTPQIVAVPGQGARLGPSVPSARAPAVGTAVSMAF